MRHLLHANIPTGHAVPGGYSDGRLVGVGDGRVRTADRHGHPGLHSTYIRWASLERFAPPFTFGGRMLVRGRLDTLRLPDQPGGVAGWDHGIVWHPVHHDNRNNVVLSIGRADQLAGALVGWSAEIDGRYGLRTGIATRVREAAPNPLDGRWHDWAIHCPRSGEFVVTWDGRQIAHVAEKTPVSHVGAAPVGFRLDGFDVELDGTYVDDHQGDDMTWNPIPRTEWLKFARHGFSGPPFPTTTVDTVAVHYTAAATTPQDYDSVARYLARIHDDYAGNRGYSIGYSFAVDRNGLIWTLRGFDVKAAANAGWNDRTVSVLCLVNGAQAANGAMIAGVRRVVAEAQRRLGRALVIVGHQDIGATACPGAGLARQVADGTFYPAPPPTPTPPPPEDDEMNRSLIRSSDSTAVFETDGANKWWVLNPPALDVKRLLYAQRGWPSDVQVIAPEHVAGFGPVVGPVPPGHDAWGRKQ